MTIKAIIKKFEKRGYKVARQINGNVTIQVPGGFSRSFDSYNEAYRYYFS